MENMKITIELDLDTEGAYWFLKTDGKDVQQIIKDALIDNADIDGHIFICSMDGKKRDFITRVYEDGWQDFEIIDNYDLKEKGDKKCTTNTTYLISHT